uniref:S-norcoclaurine synthase n=1 Tax=Nelumbo nucifera TaxID=4432 RepID=A0A191T7P5_NELNU|nr:S-norcoclaurine synthase [Nelumbo nucifera]
MHAGQLSHELEVAVPASEVWEIYGTLKLGKACEELLPDVIHKAEVVEGDGGVGTVLKVTLPPGLISYKEKFTKIDNEKRLKEVEVVEGGALDLGFRLYRIRLEIIEKTEVSSLIKSTVEYEIDDESANNASFATTKPLEQIAMAMGKYLTELKTE